jgi:hypothetical protein
MRRRSGPRHLAVRFVLTMVFAGSLGMGAGKSQAQGTSGPYRLDESWPQ